MTCEKYLMFYGYCEHALNTPVFKEFAVSNPDTPPPASQGPETGNSPLAGLRAQIDALDDQILALLAKRYALLPEVVKVKAAHGISHRVQGRVQQVIDRNVATGEKLGLPEQMVREVWDAIIEAAHRYEHQFLEK